MVQHLAKCVGISGGVPFFKHSGLTSMLFFVCGGIGNIYRYLYLNEISMPGRMLYDVMDRNHECPAHDLLVEHVEPGDTRKA